MAKTKDLLDRIDEVRAKSVTPEKFKETWGYSLEDHVEDMMDFIHELEAKDAPVEERLTDVAEGQRILPAAEPAAAAAAETKEESKRDYEKRLKAVSKKEEAAVLETLSKKVRELLKRMRTVETFNYEDADLILGEPRRGKTSRSGDSWEFKLVAVNTSGGRRLEKGAPLLITDVDNPKEERIVARVYSPGKTGQKGLAGVKSVFIEPKGLEGIALKDSVRGLMVDVGGVTLPDCRVTGPKGARGIGPKGPKM